MSDRRQEALSEHDLATVEQLVAAISQRRRIQARDVQLNASKQLLNRNVVEMATGEGKTLTTMIAAGVLAKRLSNRQVLVATANDYLVARDAAEMRLVCTDLGIQVGHVTSASTEAQRVDAYLSQVVYGTLREFAFDHLRNALGIRGKSDGPSQSAFSFDVLIIDEADSLLIDEARTPLIITGAEGELKEDAKACYQWCAKLAEDFQLQRDYVKFEPSDRIALTMQGRSRILQTAMPPEMSGLTSTNIIHAMERAVWVNENLHRDQDYVIQAGQAQLVDEYTGRKSAERQFGGGIQQAIEAREAIQISAESIPVARISIQDFVAKFRHLCGLTATAQEDRRELKTVYRLNVQKIPRHQSSQYVALEPICCSTIADKRSAIVQETQQILQAGRSVLIGTRSVAESLRLSECFSEYGMQHSVLNANHHELEATIIAKAGQPKQITIATNMAGRGTDIPLSAEVERAGGLHVIVSEMHAAARIDRQLMGRAARQGDQGSSRIFVSPEDELFLQAFGKDACGISPNRLMRKAQQAQRVLTKRHRQHRARLTSLEASLNEALLQLGLDPHLDPLFDPAN